MIATLLLGALLGLFLAYWHAIRNSSGGRHREVPHAGWEANPEGLVELRAPRHQLRPGHPAHDTAYTDLLALRGSSGSG